MPNRSPLESSESPSGTVTFLFTDIESSTRLWQQYPDAMIDALSRHDAILRGAVETSSGRVVKTTGDGVHTVFANASEGIDAADRGTARAHGRRVGRDRRVASAYGSPCG